MARGTCHVRSQKYNRMIEERQLRTIAHGYVQAEMECAASASLSAASHSHAEFVNRSPCNSEGEGARPAWRTAIPGIRPSRRERCDLKGSPRRDASRPFGGEGRYGQGCGRPMLKTIMEWRVGRRRARGACLLRSHRHHRQDISCGQFHLDLYSRARRATRESLADRD